MPITVERHDDRAHLVATATGPVSVTVLRDFICTARVGDLRLRPILIDARTATFEMTAGDLREVIAPLLTALKTAAGDRAPVAIVLEDRAALKMARMLGALVSAQGVTHLSVFQELGAAEQWLASLVDPRR